MSIPCNDLPDMQIDTSLTSPKALPPRNERWTIT